MRDETAGNPLSRAWGWYTSRMSALVLAISNLFGSLGAFNHRRTKLVLVVSLLLLIACALGWLRFRTETDGDKLWVPQDSKAKKDEKWVKEHYGTSTKAATFVATVKKGSSVPQDNVINLEAVWELWQLDAKIRALSVSKGGKPYKFSDICYRNEEGACLQDGFFNFWNMSYPTYLEAVSGSETDPSKGNTSALFASINTRTFPDGKSVSALSIFGGLQLATNPTRIVGAQAVQAEYLVDRTVSQSVTDKWMNKYLDLLKEEALRTQHTTIAYLASTSVDNEIGASVTADLYLVAIGVVVFMLVAILSISKLDAVRTRSSLAILGLLSAVLAMLAGYGLAMLIGLPFTTLQQTLPFILLGVAVDVTIILTTAYDDHALEDPTLPLLQRFRHLMATAGLSVGITTTASALAFALGTITALPAITYFSAYATLSVLCIFFSQVTFFTALFILNERRIAASRYDCLCCFTRPNAPPHPSTVAIPVPPAKSASPTTPPDTVTADADANISVPPIKAPSAATPAKKASFLTRFFAERYSRWLLWWPVRVAVVACFLAYGIFSAWAINQLREGQPLRELAPDDSYLQPYVKTMEATFERQVGPFVSLVFREVDPSAPAVQARMLQALNHTLSADHYMNITISAFQGNWLMAFIWYAAEAKVPLTPDGCFNPYVDRPEITSSVYSQFLDPQQLPGCVPQAQFYPLLEKFLQDPSHRSYKDDLVREADGRISSSLFTVLQRSSYAQDKYGRLSLEAARSAEDWVNSHLFKEANRQAKDDVFLLFSSDYTNGEGLAILKYEALIYVVMAVCGVGAVLLLMLVHPLAAALMMASVALVDLFLFGEMYILSIRFNYVSIINMIMATGLAVDYSVYLATKFMNTEGPTRAARMASALGHTGSAVFLGTCISLSGTIPLAFASSTILRTFFALLFGTVVFSALVGLVLMPVIFATVGPRPISQMARRGGEEPVEGGEGKAVAVEGAQAV